MAYTDHYKLADDVIAHLNTTIGGILDPFILSRYVGFVAIAAVTVYELAIKEIFISFAEKKHRVLGEFTRNYFDKINGRIKTSVIRDEYVKSFGDKYVQRFNQKINIVERLNLNNAHVSVMSSYGNVVTWRNQFVHQGQMPSTVTYYEIIQSYQVGKAVIECLADTMRR